MIAYAITDPSTLDFNTLEDDLKHFSSKATMIVYRDKQTVNYAKKAIKFLAQAKDFDRVFLHSDYLLAAKLHADGIHLTSMQFDDIKKAKHLGLFVMVSTHTKVEALLAEKLGADMITYSPIFYTPNKGVPLGIKNLKELVNMVSIPVIALGGIVTKNEIEACKEAGAIGFASIRYFS